MRPRSLWWILTLGACQLVWNLELTENMEEISREMVDCTIRVALALDPRKIALLFSPDQDLLAEEILKELGVPVVLNTVQVRKTDDLERRVSDDLVIILNGTQPEGILGNTLWNGDTRFLFLAQGDEELQEYFQNFWKRKVINVFGLVRAEEGALVYSFIPYLRSCEVVEVVPVDECLEGTLREKGSAVRDQSRIKDMNGCPVNISVSDSKPNLVYAEDGAGGIVQSSVRGFEGNLMKVLAKVYNFTAAFKLPDDGVHWGWIKPSPRGTVGELYLGVSDFAIGMMGPILDRYYNLDLSKSYNMAECLTFGVPRGSGAKSVAWITIFVSEFSFFTWVLITLSFVSISITNWVINKYADVNWFPSATELVLSVLSSSLGSPIKIPRFASAKTSVGIWIIGTFIITVAYKASMGSKLVIPPRDGDIFTFKELVVSDIPLTGYRNMYQVMKSEGWVYDAMRRRYQFTNHSVEDAILRMANHERLAYVRHKTAFYYYFLIHPETRGKIHLLTDCLIFYHPVVLTRKFSPFTNKLNQLVFRLEEMGIMKLWRDEFMIEFPPDKKPFRRLSFGQMYGLYYFLGVGYAVAFLSFLYEIAPRLVRPRRFLQRSIGNQT